MIFAQSDGIELVLLNHTCTRGPSFTRMQDFLKNPSVTLNQLLRDPRGAGLQETFQCLSVLPSACTYIRLSPIRSVVSYSGSIPPTPNVFTDSGPHIKWLLGGLIRVALAFKYHLPFTPLDPYRVGARVYCLNLQPWYTSYKLPEYVVAYF